MTNSEKETVLTLRGQGQSYAQIGARLGLSANTIKSFCRRENVGGGFCKNCGKPLSDVSKYKNKRFCGDCCRIEWWKKHRHLINKKAVYNMRCAGCGKDFESYGNKGRKYCCHGCYIAHRFGRAEGVP